MPKSQPQKTTLKRRRLAAVRHLVSGLKQIAAVLQSCATLPDEPLKLLPDILPTLPLHCLSDSIALQACQGKFNRLLILETIIYPTDFRKTKGRQKIIRINFL
jgi:hypothetical protein